MRLSGLALVMIAACYRPSPEGACTITCSGTCPDGLTCAAGLCVGPSGCGGGGGDGGSGSDEAGTADAQLCFGQSGGLFAMCFLVPPSGTIALIGTIDTDQASGCTHARQMGGLPDVCYIAAAALKVGSGTTYRAIGSKPLVLIASDTITIDGTIDVSSVLDQGSHPPLGAGANDAQCLVVTASTLTAGGTGGSYGTQGGRGGNGAGGSSGFAASAVNPLLVRGGCGGTAGHGDTMNPSGGASGGAVYLIAGHRIVGSTAGVVNASGAASFASAVANSVGGGGGGGAGGLIGFDAPLVAFTGTAIANGGGGASGGDQVGGTGLSGSDPSSMSPEIAAMGGPISGVGGGGGSGSVGSGDGQPGGGGAGSASGGGGGGGAGVIRVVPFQTPTFIASPPPT